MMEDPNPLLEFGENYGPLPRKMHIYTNTTWHAIIVFSFIENKLSHTMYDIPKT